MDTLRYTMTDEEMLRKYEELSKCERTYVPFETVKEGIKRKAEWANRGLPSHYISAAMQKDFADINSLRELLTIGIHKLANRYLVIDNDDNVHVKLNMMNEWQLLLADFSPLILVSSMIWYKYKDDRRSNDDLMETIAKNIKYTALPEVKDDVLDNIRDNGCVDIHLHINELMEADRAWLACLHVPSKKLEELRKNGNDKNSKEIDRYISKAIYIANHLGSHILDSSERMDDISKMLKENYDETLYNPISKIVKCETELQVESMFVIKALNLIYKNRGDRLAARYFHLYLLLMGFVRKNVVMPLQKIGIEQFNEILHTPYRPDYIGNGLSLMQFCGNKLNNCTSIEARFACKNESIYYSIEQANKFLNESKHKVLSISFIPYVVKGNDEGNKDGRYAQIYHDTPLWVSKIKSYANVVGIDVAGSDFRVSPDAFVPFVEQIRKDTNISHFTYHVAEDFYHILTGLRSVYEAVEFLQLHEGDRLSHVSAAGINSALWVHNVGDIIHMPQGQYLDDLIFTVAFIKERNLRIGKIYNRSIEVRIHELSKCIYGEEYGVKDLIEAWKLRRNAPYAIKKKAYSLLTLPEKIFCKYHSYDVCKSYNAIIEVPCFEYLPLEKLEILQKGIMKYLCDKGIVVEVLPTCNVFVGHHKSFQTYHLLRWLGWVNTPKFVVGSDEPGVFSTNIFNEYSNLYCMMLNNRYSKGYAEEKLKTLADNSKSYIFK